MARAQHVGVDENGLGPRLGPMVVTGALVALDAPMHEVLAAGVSSLVSDSKALCAHGDMARVEALVLAILDVHLGLRPRTYAELQAMVGLQDDARLRALCPRGAAPRMCFEAEVPLPAFGAAVDARAMQDAARLRAMGMSLLALRQGYACARLLNVERARGVSRFDVDLDLMIELVAALRARAEGDVEAVCGKVGGRKSYGAAMSSRWPLVAVLEETAAVSRYAVPSVGTVCFARDADASDPAVSLASLFGKYARELAMARIHAFFASRVESLRPVSGYHDPVTARYVEATRLVREREGIDDGCFAR